MNTKYYKASEPSPNGLYRITAARDIPLHNVKAGDVGGYIANDLNLTQTGECWIAGEARVSGHARVYGDALVSGEAVVSGLANVFYTALVTDRAQVHDAVVTGKVKDAAIAQGNVVITSDYVLEGDAQATAPNGHFIYF